MAELHIHETYSMRLTPGEFALIVKALAKLKAGDGGPLQDAMELRDALLRSRAHETLQRAEKARDVLSGLQDAAPD